MLKLKLQYSSHLIRRADLLKETMMLGKTFKGPLDSEEIKPINLKGNQS